MTENPFFKALEEEMEQIKEDYIRDINKSNAFWNSLGLNSNDSNKYKPTYKNRIKRWIKRRWYWFTEAWHTFWHGPRDEWD